MTTEKQLENMKLRFIPAYWNLLLSRNQMGLTLIEWNICEINFFPGGSYFIWEIFKRLLRSKLSLFLRFSFMRYEAYRHAYSFCRQEAVHKFNKQMFPSIESTEDHSNVLHSKKVND